MVDIPPELRAEFRAAVNDEAANWISHSLAPCVRQAMQAATLELLGMQKSGGRYTLRDRQGEHGLWKLVNDRTRERVERYLTQAANRALDELERDQRAATDLAARIGHQIAQELNHKSWDLARQISARLHKLVENDLTGEIEAQLTGQALVNEEAENPDSYEGRLGKLLLNHLAQQLVAEFSKHQP